MRYISTLFISLILLCPGVALALVNINTASLDELDTLPGVGPATAQKIVDTRPFSSTSEIQNVQGIGGPGSKTYEDIIGLITVSGGTTVTENEADNADDVADDNQTTSFRSGGNKEETHEPVSGLTLIMPSVAYAGQLIDFDVNPTDGTNNRLVRYAWNFGDGQTSSEKATEHQYARAGTYVVVVESYFQKETKSARREIVILPLTLDFNSLPGGGVEVTNKGEHEINLSGMILHGNTEFVFPKNTILLAGKSFVVDPVSGPNIALKDETGRPLAFKESSGKSATTLATAPTRSAARPRAPRTVSSPSALATSTPLEATNPSANANLAAVAAAETPAKTWPYLGLLGVVAVGFLALFGTKRL